MDCLTPPTNSSTVKIISGMSGPGAIPLNNLNDIWLQGVKKLQSGDIMVCGGDFVQAASPEYCFPTKVNDVLKVSVDQAATWAINPDYEKACTTPEELQSCQKGFTSSGIADSECICPCEDSIYKPKLSGGLLIEETINAMKRGAKIVFMDDIIFIASVFPDNKKGHDFVFTTLQNASNTMSIDHSCKGGGFYWYMFGQACGWVDMDLSIHSKITILYFIGPSHVEGPHLTTTLGSFNPSYPISLTLEIGTIVTGLLTNTLCKAAGYLVFDVLTGIINSAYKGGVQAYNGKVWNGQSGFSQNGCPSYKLCKNGSIDTTPLHCTIPPCSKDDKYGFFQPWYSIGKALGATDSSGNLVLAKWWTNIPDSSMFKVSSTNLSFPVYGEDTFANDEISTDVEFCGLAFCSDYTKKHKHGKTNEQRITFVEKNVEIKIGAEPTGVFPRFHFGLGLVNSIFGEAQKYVKVGIMTSMTKGPTCSVMENTWVLSSSHNIPKHPLQLDSSKADPLTGQFLNFVDKGLPLYIIQKLDMAPPKCAFECSSDDPSKCEAVTMTKSAFPDTCYNNFGDPSNIPPCSTSSDCEGLPCEIAEHFSTNGAYCGFEQKNALVKATNLGESITKKGQSVDGGNLFSWLRAQEEIATWGNSYTPCASASSTLNVFSTVTCNNLHEDSREDCMKGGIVREDCLKNPNCCFDNTVNQKNWRGQMASASGLTPWCYKKLEAQSSLENGELQPISSSNPYPIFFKYYESGFHWKFYMSEKSLLFSSQHPSDIFYGVKNGGTMGYDIKWSNCPRMIAYYDTVFNWVWENKTYDAPGYDPSYASLGGVCYKSSQASSTSSKECSAGFSYSSQRLLPPICSTNDCCSIPGATNVQANPGDIGSCYPGGLGKRSDDVPKGAGILRWVLLSILGIVLIVGVIFLFLRRGSSRVSGIR